MLTTDRKTNKQGFRVDKHTFRANALYAHARSLQKAQKNVKQNKQNRKTKPNGGAHIQGGCIGCEKIHNFFVPDF